MEDEGRQRVTKYVAWEYEGQSELSLKFEEEKKKIIELSKKYNVGGVSNSPLINGGRNRARKDPVAITSIDGGEGSSGEGVAEGPSSSTGSKKAITSAEGDGSDDERADPSFTILNSKKLLTDKRAHHHQKRDNPHVTYRCKDDIISD